MRIRLFHIPLLVILLIVVSSCDNHVPNKQTTLTNVDSVFTVAALQYHGQFYPGVDGHVLSLDLYSDGLYIDSLGHMQGSGTNIYFSDIFISKEDTCLVQGLYRIDSTALPMTILPGQTIEGSITGSYLLLVQEGQVKRIELFESGSVDVIQDTDSCWITMQMVTSNNKTYNATYIGLVP